MAQLGDLARAKDLLRSAARGFGPNEATARARCVVAEAEIALVSRDLSRPMQTLGAARAALEAHGDRANAAHAGYLEARRLLLIGRLDEAERTLDALDIDALPQTSRTGYWLVAAGIAMRRIRAGAARAALDRAGHAARETGIPALAAEVDRASRALDAPAACLIARDAQRSLRLAEVEALIASDTLVVDACRNVVRAAADDRSAGRSPGAVRARPRPRRGVARRRIARNADRARLPRRALPMTRIARGCASRSGGCARHSAAGRD